MIYLCMFLFLVQVLVPYSKIRYPISYANSILDALSLVNLPGRIFNYDLSVKLHPNSFVLLRSSAVLSFQATSNLLNSFLLAQVYEQRNICGFKRGFGQEILYCSTGQYDSRISNLADLLELVGEFGLIPIDPSQYSLPQLINLLSDAQCILAESGTATLNACMFSSPVIAE